MIQTPQNQKRLTNVAIVRLKKGGKRFEIACFPNKVLSWRNGVEKDIDEVLQTHSVFTNVSKGVGAKKDELLKSFGIEDEDKICLEILAKGELQVSDKERANQFENIFKDIANIVAEKCVNPQTNRPFTLAMVERAMKDIHYNPHPNSSAKQQALEVIRQLKLSGVPIERAQMRLEIRANAKEGKLIKEQLSSKHLFTKLESEEWTDGYTTTLQADPGSFRAIEEVVRMLTKGKAEIEVLSLCVSDVGDENIEDHTRARQKLGPVQEKKNVDEEKEDVEEEEEEDENKDKGFEIKPKPKPKGKGKALHDEEDNEEKPIQPTGKASGKAKPIAKAKGKKAKGRKGRNEDDNDEEEEALMRKLAALEAKDDDYDEPAQIAKKKGAKPSVHGFNVLVHQGKKKGDQKDDDDEEGDSKQKGHASKAKPNAKTLSSDDDDDSDDQAPKKDNALNKAKPAAKGNSKTPEKSRPSDNDNDSEDNESSDESPPKRKGIPVSKCKASAKPVAKGKPAGKNRPNND